jgi:hypothetical protein
MRQEVDGDGDRDAEEEAHRGGDDRGRRRRDPCVGGVDAKALEERGADEGDEGRDADETEEGRPGARVAALSRPAVGQLTEGDRDRHARWGAAALDANRDPITEVPADQGHAENGPLRSLRKHG